MTLLLNMEYSSSESDNQAIATSKKAKKQILSDDESSDDKTKTAEDIFHATPSKMVDNNTPRTRSSERLKQKSRRQFSVPDRKETLDKIEVRKKIKYENLSLKRRRQMSDYVRGSNRYVMDKEEIFISDNSELSDFIDDSEEVSKTKGRKTRKRSVKKSKDDKTGQTITRKKKMKTKNLSKKGKMQSEEKSSCKEMRKQKRAISSGEDSDVGSRTIKKDKSLSISDEEKSWSSLDEDSENIELLKTKNHSRASELDSSGSDELFEPSRRLPRRTKSAKKEKQGKLLEKLTAKRKNKKMKLEQQNNKTDNVRTWLGETSASESEMTDEDLGIEDELEEGESDQDFVVNDDEFDADSNTEEVTQFYKHLHSGEIAVDNDQLRVKKSNGYCRIVIPTESDDSNDETFLQREIYNNIKENNIDSVMSELKKYPDIINDLGPKRRSLLHHAAMYGSAQITKLLLNFNANQHVIDAFSLQPLGYAILTGNTECLELLLPNADLLELDKMCKDRFKFGLLHLVVGGSTRLPDLKCELAGDSGLFQCLQILFKYDESIFLKLINDTDSQGFTPGAVAIIAGNTECAEFLLSNGASVDNFKTTNGGNLLHLAVECSIEFEQVDRTSCLKLLLCTSLKHKLDALDNIGFSPLMYAAESGNHDCVLVLLEAGASVLCKDAHGTTSLHLAAASGDTQCVKLLLQYGHQVDCLDSCGWPPLLYANFAAQEDCVLSLMEPNPKQIFVLGDLLRRGGSEAARERNFKVVKDVLVALANQDAYYRVFNDFVRCNPDFLLEYDSGILHKTWRALLDFDNKLRWFRQKLAKQRSGSLRLIRLKVDREAVFESAMKTLGHFSGSSLRNCELSVTFKNEEGICTGPKREFFVNICKDIVDTRHELFHLTDDNQYSFYPNAYFAEMAKIQGGNLEGMTSTQDGMTNMDVGDQTSTIDRDSVAGDICFSSCLNRRRDTFAHSTDAPPDSLACSSDSGVTCLNVLSADNDHDVGVHVFSGTSEECDDALSSVEGEDVRVHFMDERGDMIIAEIDTSTLENSSPIVTTQSSHVLNSSVDELMPLRTATSTSSVEFMDEGGDRIIAELDTNKMEDKTTSKTEDKRLADENRRKAFAMHVDRKLAQNIAQLKFLGRIVGTAICEGHFLNFHLCKPLVKQIIGIQLKHPEDLSSFDYELHKNFVTFILESDNVEELMLPCDLNVVNPWNGHCTTLRLFESNEEYLNEKNKVEYVNLVSQHKLTVLVKKELDAFSRGLYEVIPKTLFSLFTADEFSLLINGVSKIDVDDWRKNTVYTPPDAASTRNEIKWFWEIVRDLKENEKALLLKFSTGSPCVPAGGFSELQGLHGPTKFHISMKSDQNKIPTASTCFNNLKLPLFDAIKDLKDKLLIAIRHGTEGFTFS